MLHELRIENLLLIDRAELHLAPGLNVVTGETGAGKTLLAQSLDLLLGGRAGAGVVRSGAREAYVEGVFSLPDELAGLELLPEGAEEIVLARRVWPDGRTRAYVCGRSATVADLREFGSALLAALSERVAALVYEAQDAGAGLRAYADGLEDSPGRLEEVEERLAQFARLERKHGGSIAEVLAHAERCRRRRQELERAEVSL